MEINLVVVADELNGIGFQNKLLCHLPNDLKYFKKLTSGHTILMGRKTVESIGKPLPNRRNLVVSKSGNPIPGCEVYPSPEEALNKLKSESIEKLYVIGGASIYEQLLSQSQRVYLTRIHHRFQADAFFPELSQNDWKQVSKETHPADENNAYPHTFEVYERLNSK